MLDMRCVFYTDDRDGWFDAARDAFREGPQ
jgi:hypothetical protein